MNSFKLLRSGTAESFDSTLEVHNATNRHMALVIAITKDCLLFHSLTIFHYLEYTEIREAKPASL
ncbi:hypothetical protein PHOSAC3_150051 [Mesotoga infera]|nr:hypothetical protein PHOSAC3_150051 [Mesotoga infera]